MFEIVTKMNKVVNIQRRILIINFNFQIKHYIHLLSKYKAFRTYTLLDNQTQYDIETLVYPRSRITHVACHLTKHTHFNISLIIFHSFFLYSTSTRSTHNHRVNTKKI